MSLVTASLSTANVVKPAGSAIAHTDAARSTPPPSSPRNAHANRPPACEAITPTPDKTVRIARPNSDLPVTVSMARYCSEAPAEFVTSIQVSNIATAATAAPKARPHAPGFRFKRSIGPPSDPIVCHPTPDLEHL